MIATGGAGTTSTPSMPCERATTDGLPTAEAVLTAAFSPALLTDLYELTMAAAYFEERMADTAVFSLFVRRLPERRNYLLACGLDDVLAFLETFRFDERALGYLDSLGRFSARFLRHLEQFRFTGDIFAVPEGTPVFAAEPILEIAAPITEAQVAGSGTLTSSTPSANVAFTSSNFTPSGSGTVR
jgi:putative nicotinate phosphoribosyltransferase